MCHVKLTDTMKALYLRTPRKSIVAILFNFVSFAAGALPSEKSWLLQGKPAAMNYIKYSTIGIQ